MEAPSYALTRMSAIIMRLVRRNDQKNLLKALRPRIFTALLPGQRAAQRTFDHLTFFEI